MSSRRLIVRVMVELVLLCAAVVITVRSLDTRRYGQSSAVLAFFQARDVTAAGKESLDLPPVR